VGDSFSISQKNFIKLGLIVFIFGVIALTSYSAVNVREPASRAASYSKPYNASSMGMIHWWEAPGYPVENYTSVSRCEAVPANPLYIGQGSTSYFREYRSYIKFDTRDIPSNATVTSASLQFTVVSNPYYRAPQWFTLQARDYNWTDPITCAQWGGKQPGGLVGGHDTYDLSSTYSFGITLSSVKKAAFSSFMLTSSHEVSLQTPTSLEYITLSSPKIIVVYSVPDQYIQPTQPTQPTQPSQPTKTTTPTGSKTVISAGPSGPFESLQLGVSIPYLVGSLKVKVEVGGVEKEIEMSPETKNYSLDLRGASLTTNKEYSLVATSGKTLIKKVKFTPTSSAIDLNIGDLILGDINQDNTIDSKDQLTLIDSITKQSSKGDLNLDEAINSFDWAILLSNLGKSGD